MDTQRYYRLVSSETEQELGTVFYDDHASCWRWDNSINGAFNSAPEALQALGSSVAHMPVHIVSAIR